MADKALQSLSLPGLNDTYVNTPLSTAPTFVTTQNYAVDDCVFYNRKLYKFVTAHSAGAWDNSHVQEITIADELSDVRSDLTQKYEKPSTGIPASDLAQGVIPDVPVQDVQVNGTTVLGQDGIADVPSATTDNYGVVLIGNGLQISPSTGKLMTNPAISTQVKTGTESFRQITPNIQHQSTFYGLAKAAGDTTQSSSSNAVGTYTEEAKKAICNMIGVKYEEPFRLIKEIEITEETGKIVITTDNSNTPFVLSEIIILFKSMTANGSSAGGVGINTETWSGAYLVMEGTYNSSARTTVAHLEVKGGRLFGNSGYGFSQTYSRGAITTSTNASGIIPCDLIQKITIASLNNHSFTGGIITIYGR